MFDQSTLKWSCNLHGDKDGGFLKEGILNKIFNKKMPKVFGTIPKSYDFFIVYFLFSKISPLFSIFGFFFLLVFLFIYLFIYIIFPILTKSNLNSHV